MPRTSGSNGAPALIVSQKVNLGRNRELTLRHRHFVYAAPVSLGVLAADVAGLIAASFFTVLYNAFYCQPKTVLLYSTVNLVCGILGSYLPFQKWFNERKYKVRGVHLLKAGADEQNWRINFFLFLCFAMFAPMLQLFYQHGWDRGLAFVGELRCALRGETSR